MGNPLFRDFKAFHWKSESEGHINAMSLESTISFFFFLIIEKDGLSALYTCRIFESFVPAIIILYQSFNQLITLTLSFPYHSN